jgi:nitrile hydratase accessory protein
VSESVLDIEGPAAPPRANGELVFAEPWESRAFGLALTLHHGCVFEWEEFRQQLIAAIAGWEADHQPGAEYSYYRCWLAALERVLATHDLVDPQAVERRATELAGRPQGHDH